MLPRSFAVSLLVSAVAALSAENAAAASGCLKDTRQTKVDQANVAHLLGYLCTSNQDAQTRIRVQFQRLSGLTTGVVLNGGSAPWLASLYGSYQVVNNDVLKEYKTLIDRFGSAVRKVHEASSEGLSLRLLAGTPAQGASRELSETARGRKGQVVKSFELAQMPDVPLVDETLQILNEQTWPTSLSMFYGQPQDEKGSPADTMSLWRYLTANDAREYGERLRRYNAIVVDRSYFERKALPKSMELLNYLTANGWPKDFLYTKTDISKSEPCLTLDFKVNQPSFEVEVAIIENASTKPLTINQLFGQPGGGNTLRTASVLPKTTGKQSLSSEPMILAPMSRLVVPLRLVFAAEVPDGYGTATSQAEERKLSQESFRKLMARPQGTVFSTEIYSALRGNTRGKEDTYVIRKVRESYKPPSYPAQSDFAFGPEWALSGVDVGGETIAFDATPPNVIMITASSEVGSCPILYSWNSSAGRWLRHGKVLHQAQTRFHEASERVRFDGFVHRFRIAEEELERATLREMSLQLELDDGRTLMLHPKLQKIEPTTPQIEEYVTELYANDVIEITFALPSNLKASQVARSIFTVTGYYERYVNLLMSAAMSRTDVGGRSE